MIYTVITVQFKIILGFTTDGWKSFKKCEVIRIITIHRGHAHIGIVPVTDMTV